jgi:hypothetical protein
MSVKEDQEERTSESQEEQFSKWKRAFKILQGAVEDCQLRDFSEFKEGEFLENHWRTFKYEHQGDISLIVLASGLFGTLQWEFFLLKGVAHIVEQLEELLRRPNADKVFALSEEDDLEEVLNLHARALTSNYIHYLPVVMYQSLKQSLDDTIRGYFKNVIEPNLKEHWKSLGMPDDFALLPESELQKYDRQMEDLRKIYVGEKRPKLTREQLSQLVELYQTLRSEYQAARRFHNQARETFFKSNITARDKDGAWRKAWSSMASDMFPSLNAECLDLLADLNYLPYELATRHLAHLYRYSFEYMRNLLKSPKRVRRKKKANSKKKVTNSRKSAKKISKPQA